MTQPSIGVFDSGVGGLSVLREIRHRLPNESLIYFADQEHVPYGSRLASEIRALSEGITRFLLDQDCRLIVLACNTASAAALGALRSRFPATPFVGMEPAVKPAAKRTATRKVAILATPATFQGELFASAVDRFAHGVEVIELVAVGLVELVEAGKTASEEVDSVLRQPLGSALEHGIDTLVLACTHYSFVIPSIQRILGPDVTVIDPALAGARETERLWENREREASIQSGTSTQSDTGAETGTGTRTGTSTQSGTRTREGKGTRYITSGDPIGFRSSLFNLIGDEAEAEPATWEAGVPRIRKPRP